MGLKDELIELRKSTGMNKRQFSEYFGIGNLGTAECRNICSA